MNNAPNFPFNLTLAHAEIAVLHVKHLGAQGKSLNGMSQGKDPFRLDTRITDFMPKLIILNSNAVEEGRGFVKYHDQLVADGNISVKDEQALQTY